MKLTISELDYIRQGMYDHIELRKIASLKDNDELMTSVDSSVIASCHTIIKKITKEIERLGNLEKCKSIF